MKNENINNIYEIKSKFSVSEKMLKKAEDELKILQDIKHKRENPQLIKEENEELEITHLIMP